MDKYTVDLDKVLNDFEYSELAEQCEREAAASSSTHRIRPSPPTKHSITHVFNSLHEYLNTDISGTKDRELPSLNPLDDRPADLIPDDGDDYQGLEYDANDYLVDVGAQAPMDGDEQLVDVSLASIELDLSVAPLEVVEEHEEIVEEEVEPPGVAPPLANVQEEKMEDQGGEEVAVKAIGFDANVDVDEEEMHKYFEEMEAASGGGDGEEKEQIIENGVDNGNDEIKKNHVESMDDKVVEVVVDKWDGSCVESVEERLAVASESVEKGMETLSVSKEESGGCDDVKTEDADNTISRPNSLPIESSEPHIDLIGDPGSTPYNNVYVTKQLDKDEETESSLVSASPTFSDISSGSTRSTETTESVTDSVGRPSDGAQSQQAQEAEPELVVEHVDATDTPPCAAPTETNNYGWLGKQAPLWIPDSEAVNCLHCAMKFTVIKRRHHCRACGLVLCSKCCNLRLKLDYLEAEARICTRCHDHLTKETSSNSGSDASASASPSHAYQPHPNNPMEYCSVVPPMQQMRTNGSDPPTVMVPVGVLKRTGSSKQRTTKSVIFCDGIRPGSELTNLDNDFNYNAARSSGSSKKTAIVKPNRNLPVIDAKTKSFISDLPNSLPPTVIVYKSDVTYTECSNTPSVVEMLRNETLTFALQSNLHVHVKIINMDCCINKHAWCFSTEGMMSVGQDEIVILLEMLDNEDTVPKDVFFHLNMIYEDAKKGTSITELGLSVHDTPTFLDSKNHVGFLYVRPSFQCLQGVIVPNESYLIGVLIHRWETPWAKIFPLRLILRLGAEYRYYPNPIISSRHRDSVYVEIGHTIINLLADFRNFSYTLPNIRGLTIHMEEKNTTVTIPSNQYDQVMKCLNNSSDHILAFAGNFSLKADSHLVCIQDTQGSNENTYTTHAINIHNKPRKVTGASFIVFNGALKSTSGLTAKSSIVEDGLMIQIPLEQMGQIRENLRNMKSHTIQCGCVNATSDETVNIVWGEDDANFNMGIVSPIDGQQLGGVPSIRVHNGKDYVCNSGQRMIRWTEVFILQNSTDNAHQDVDFSKLAENVSKATVQALVKYLDLLSSNNFYKIGIRASLNSDDVSYAAGSNGVKLPPIYMRSLDNELVRVLHRVTENLGDSAIVLELIFRILNA